MIEKMKSFARSKGMCVLATVSDGKPHCSLMAYATDNNCEEIYMATSGATQKFKNILVNPYVSILIDSREIKPRSNAQALTVEGVCKTVSHTAKRATVSNILAEKHPHLQKILSMADVEILSVQIMSFLLLDGLTDAYFEKLDENRP